ncbi:uncharacterized protein F5Z01DRAFT_626996 [Emericellopsis atlantica]|uniref:Dihydroorotate oxidase n=1 Tax=Emericellopsis atlantica TaxID=2614577 RepID=A0A9P8CNI5_9HYPO|nr:uncharacterized protein F5Z01DRAFT_626996 [Emericellopsis atlantica]KAG9251761.1 hypothetical protein F5Z01DRAFT_626996 [Emericellopsis atlantica]
MPPLLSAVIELPLFNSASPWATTEAQLRELLECPATGAVTVRTSLMQGFDHRPGDHRFTFFTAGSGEVARAGTQSYPDDTDKSATDDDADCIIDHDDAPCDSTLNNLGYSPYTLPEYLEILQKLSNTSDTHKCFILSVTGTAADVRQCYEAIVDAKERIRFPLAMEVNLSCPNIPNSPPVAYTKSALSQYIRALPENPEIPVGIKMPPYTHAGQYDSLKEALLESGAASRLSFVTAVNTLGSCLILESTNTFESARWKDTLPGGGFGGMAGAALHPLALGNVRMLRNLLDSEESLSKIEVIGVGGVGDTFGYGRMRAAGATFVALASALGAKGIRVFYEIV